MKLSGTSMASPNVANLAGKLFALDPGLTPAQVAARLEDRFHLMRRQVEDQPDLVDREFLRVTQHQDVAFRAIEGAGEFQGESGARVR